MQNEVLQRLKCGSHKAFDVIYKDSHKKVYAYFLLKTSREEMAQDLTQQTFIKIWKYHETVNLELSIDQQIFQKARQVFIDWLRKEAVSRKLLCDSEQTDCNIIPDPNSIRVIQNIDIEHTLSRAMHTLPKKRKQVFELKHVQGMTYKEIAEYLHISVKTVDNHLLKATAQLRKYFLFFCLVLQLVLIF